MQRIQATEQGLQLTLDANGYDLSTSSPSLYAIVLGPDGSRQQLTLGLDASHTTASRVTLATDFPIPGEWKIQLKVSYGGNYRLSSVATQIVGPAL